MFFGDLCVHFETLLGKKKHTYATIKEMKKRPYNKKSKTNQKTAFK